MLPSKEHITGTFMERFIDATCTVRVDDDCDQPVMTFGYINIFTFNLGSDGRLQLKIEDRDAYTYTQVSHLVIEGEWELMIFRPDSFAIRINNPEIKILSANAEDYVKAIQNHHLLWVSDKGAYFQPFPGYETSPSEIPQLATLSSETSSDEPKESQPPADDLEKYGIRKPLLVSAEQLPDIAGEGELVFVWDQLEWDSVILYGDLVVWREWTGFEVFERFEEILAILKQKYGKRLIDVVPTQRSHYCLYGDRFRASGVVESARQSLRKNG